MSEEMMRAAKMMQHAAEEVSRAVLNMSAALEQHQRYLDHFLERLAPIMSPPEPPPEEAGWHDWKGCFSPVEAGTKVHVKYRNGSVATAPAGMINWRHYKVKFEKDVVAWKPE